MSRRWLKDLKVNGLVVGQYLGSDDTAEDLAAAHDLLRAKGIQSPSALAVMLGHADSFAYVANGIYEELRNRGPDRPLVAAPFVVNAAFSVELYLKTLHMAASGTSPREHKLLELYDGLLEAHRNELRAETARLAPEHGQSIGIGFRDLLLMLNDSFREWRYVYEQSRSGTIHFQQTILTMHACREVGKRIVYPAAPQGTGQRN